MLNFNNTIANLQQKLERAEAEAAQSQEELDQSIHKAGSETLMVGQVIMAVQNLLQRCTKNHGAIKHYDDSKNNNGMHLEEPKTAEEELYMKGEKTKENLDVIAAYVNDFAAIVDDYANLHK